MNFNNRSLKLKSFGTLALIYAVLYLFAHLEYLYFYEASGIVWEYVNFYASKIADFVIPVAVASVSFTVLCYKGAAAAFMYALAASSARMVFTLPFYYIYFIVNYGYDSVESILLSALASLATLALSLLFTLLSLTVAVLLLRKKRTLSEMREAYASLLQDTVSRDYASGANKAITILALCRFAYAMISEIIDTVTFFIEYGDDYTFTEALLPVIHAVLYFALLIASYLLAKRIKDSVVSTHVSE